MLDTADPHPVTDTLTEEENVENPGLEPTSLNSALTEAMGLNIEEVEQGKNWL